MMRLLHTVLASFAFLVLSGAPGFAQHAGHEQDKPNPRASRNPRPVKPSIIRNISTRLRSYRLSFRR
jgi:hypothetical protein